MIFRLITVINFTIYECSTPSKFYSENAGLVLIVWDISVVKMGIRVGETKTLPKLFSKNT